LLPVRLKIRVVLRPQSPPRGQPMARSGLSLALKIDAVA
jgi:hypothetical protein